MKDNFFLILSPSEWSDNAVSNMQISAILSKNNKVVYVETIGTRLPKISEWRRVVGRILNFFVLVIYFFAQIFIGFSHKIISLKHHKL